MRCQRKQSVCKGTRGGAVVNKLRGQINKTPPHFGLSFPTVSLNFCFFKQIWLSPLFCLGMDESSFSGLLIKWSKGVQVPSVCSEISVGKLLLDQSLSVCWSRTPSFFLHQVFLEILYPAIIYPPPCWYCHIICLPSLEVFHLVPLLYEG